MEQKATLARQLLPLVARALASKLKIPALDFAGGIISKDQAVSRALGAFIESHANAAFAGRSLNGIAHPIDDADRALGRLVSQEQSQYFEGFLGQILAGKYNDENGEIREDAIEARSSLYGARLRGTANESWAISLPEGELVHWRTGATEDHCSVCPSLEEDGPYKRNELPTHPGNNETPCLFNCLCYLESDSGSQGFKALEIEHAGFFPDSHILDPFAGLRKGHIITPCKCSKKH
jgi:hypothetical protein